MINIEEHPVEPEKKIHAKYGSTLNSQQFLTPTKILPDIKSNSSELSLIEQRLKTKTDDVCLKPSLNL